MKDTPTDPRIALLLRTRAGSHPFMVWPQRPGDPLDAGEQARRRYSAMLARLEALDAARERLKGDGKLTENGLVAALEADALELARRLRELADTAEALIEGGRKAIAEATPPGTGGDPLGAELREHLRGLSLGARIELIRADPRALAATFEAPAFLTGPESGWFAELDRLRAELPGAAKGAAKVELGEFLASAVDRGLDALAGIAGGLTRLPAGWAGSELPPLVAAFDAAGGRKIYGRDGEERRQELEDHVSAIWRRAPVAAA